MAFTPRLYQELIAAKALEQNTLVVLPTGLGKTAIAVLCARMRLKKGKILMLAPTRPLVQQHVNTFEQDVDADVRLFTGQLSPTKRTEAFSHSIILSTPQTIENDLLNKRYDLSEVSLLIIDEAHRATGDYSYVWIAEQYMKQAKEPLVLALSASPGAEREKVEEVTGNLHIEHIEYRTRDSPDVAPYVEQTDMEWKEVTLDQRYKNLILLLRKCLTGKINELKHLGYLKQVPAHQVSRKDILGFQAYLQNELRKSPGSETYAALSLAAQVMKVMHGLELLESQGIEPLRLYLDDLFEQAKKTKTKATIILAQDEHLLMLRSKLDMLHLEHPKLEVLTKLITEKLAAKSDAKVIVFNQYRDSIVHIVEQLNKINGIKAEPFVGQAKKRGTGLTQKEQLARVQDFASGVCNVLVMSSVGEEGLDIPEVDLVVFYEPVPSAIRSIQRRGRTGRHARGSVIVLVAKGTRDEAYRWSTHHKEKKMHTMLSGLQQVKAKLEKQTSLENFESTMIIADDREKSRGIIKELMNMGVEVKLQRLQVADYVLGSDIGIEFKTAADFVDSLIDGRLLSQIGELKKAFPTPLLVVEGESIFTQRNVHANALYGALASIMLSYKVPIFFTANSKETAQLFLLIGKKYQSGNFSALGYQKSVDIKDQQKQMVGQLPGVGPELAERLLKKFGSVKSVLLASEHELLEIEGVGKEKAKSIVEFINKLF